LGDDTRTSLLLLQREEWDLVRDSGGRSDRPQVGTDGPRSPRSTMRGGLRRLSIDVVTTVPATCSRGCGARSGASACA
jgi:hypothetical protein